ncbi:MAG: carboxymuconolactone decarboxylase family protein [Deltaproteobacteria bacterium]|nr:carboxymuconolactone decarboxylase family protein [Deltaproteobacteria bacterium]
MSARIAPLAPPYEDAVSEALSKWMPREAGVPPLALFRTIALHPMLRERMHPLAAGLRGRGTLPLRVRELVILRTCARCEAWYEWGVHATAFAAAAGIDHDALRTITHATAAEIAARSDEDALVLQIADELHDTSKLSERVFAAGVERFGAQSLLEIGALAGFYHLISFLIGIADVEPEPWAQPAPTHENARASR